MNYYIHSCPNITVMYPINCSIQFHRSLRNQGARDVVFKNLFVKYICIYIIIYIYLYLYFIYIYIYIYALNLNGETTVRGMLRYGALVRERLVYKSVQKFGM